MVIAGPTTCEISQMKEQWNECSEKGMGYLLYRAADSTVAKVGIDLDQEVAAHNGGFQLCVALVGGDDGSPPRHLHTMFAFLKFTF